MKKFSLTHKLLAVALAFVLVAVSLPDYLSFAQQPAQEQSETDELADGDPSDDDLSGDNRLTPGNRKWNSRSSCICRRLRLSRWGQREVLGFQPKIQQQPLLMSLSS